MGGWMNNVYSLHKWKCSALVQDQLTFK